MVDVFASKSEKKWRAGYQSTQNHVTWSSVVKVERAL